MIGDRRDPVLFAVDKPDKLLMASERHYEAE